MNKLFIFFTFFTAANSFGQTTNDKNSGMLADTTITQNRDTALRVILLNKKKPDPQQTAFFINGKHVINQSLISSLNPNWIEDIEVIKRDTLIGNISFSGQVQIKTKNNYSPKFISLADLKTKYTDYKEKPVLFMLDGNIINANYDNYLIDENNLLTIQVENVEIDKKNVELGIIKLLTKTEENIKKRGQIISVALR